jgi:hypothetical protein
LHARLSESVRDRRLANGARSTSTFENNLCNASLLAWGADALANLLAYNFILQPQGVEYLEFFWLPPYLWLGALALALLVSILAALYPAARAARVDPVTALRHD